MVRLRRVFAVGVAALALLGLSHHFLLPGNTTVAPRRAGSPGDRPRLTRKQRDAFSHHLLVDDHYKLVLCAVPKVGSTEFARLILRMGNSTHWRRDPQRSGLAQADRDRHVVSKLSLQRAQRLIDDRRYTWAVFFRDPAERLVSAYRDRVRPRLNISFAAFVSTLKANRGADPHWRPQRYLCNNDILLKRYDFVGDFARIQPDARRLLEALGAWDIVGKKGWGAHRSREPVFSGAAARARASREASARYYTPELLARVRRAYATDYAMLRAIRRGEVGG